MARYVAFLSYSHRNKAETEWLHKALERYVIPKKLVGRETAKGKVPARLIPVFRDRDELAVSADLGGDLHGALENSEHLIVVASPASAHSTYVQEEIRYFKSLHGENRVFALIVGGEPYASAMPGREEEEAFSVSLRYRLGADGQLTDTPAEPIAADIRPGKDGRRLALMKLIAGITGLRLDDLVQREAQRRARRLTWIATAASVGMLLTTGLAFYANQQRAVAVEQRVIAERETAAARAATDYLIGTFELSDPATENPRTVSLVTILSRGAERARTELRNQPEIEARLVTAVGRAYTNLGLLDDSEVALARAMPAIKRAGPDGAPALIALANNYLRKGQPERALQTLSNADSMLGQDRKEHVALRAQLAAMRGNIAYINGEADQALGFFDEAVRFVAAEKDIDPKLRADVLEGRGRILIDLGRLDEAEASLQEANRLFRAYRGEQHLNTGYNFFYLALAAYNGGEYQLAEQRISRSLAIVSRVLDKTNPIRADVLSLQGSIYQAEGKLDLADTALAEAIDAYRAVYKGPHYNIGIAEFYRAQVAEQHGDLRGAIRHLDEAQRNYEASYGKRHANIGEVLVTRASLLDRTGNHARAVAECAEGIEMLNATMGADSGFTKGLKATCDAIGKKGVNRAG
ncbi:tetratricopeptide repeat protein [Sandaracinobacter neustonicus]|uniref:Tetratricopeptide repeat protein n=2 Tax=Sandaracinobacter neustonicus TaxID=1715348 RepID=A0A501XMV4_9SPHN|nr:tetratricopeptide repeat protein [Sandaracinobacter neustonicus]